MRFAIFIFALQAIAFTAGIVFMPATFVPQCNSYPGENVAHTNIAPDGTLTCVYIRHTRGLAKTLRVQS